MNLTVHQSIYIHFLRIGTVASSSIVQIGSSGVIQAKADLYNTGGYTEPAPEALPKEGEVDIPEAGTGTLVPLSIT
ncbi:spore germination protein PB [Halobacillus karajensis]|uniref:Spore germination protein GerPB n=1 Tax=Halobacillus karajensis TaxID=195088 RepID=A0A024P7E8_9BACI|nr:spore germination protein GerPB [Halobacillus karajensis]CDQ21071.1 putative spore germination protein GerPB [Halobacillus karajensis]CDQ24865.1 putative spore germination protein GerPB [Halobacillus karajensis]CDQ28775.1 putative spore germination protein GerPB [Halobacillus karajensis]SEH96570.1 spore germination protein PB [Halobacillus karajensis]